MPYSLQDRLVIGLASSALFDLAESDAIFRTDGEEAYREYQELHLDDRLNPGVAFPFVQRLLSLNDLGDEDDPLIEVIILSRNDPDTGLRVMNSIEAYGLPITRAIFMQGKSPYKFMPALNMSLFLSANDRDVREAVAANLPAGRVLDSTYVDDPADHDLRIAFDFDGVIADDGSEQIFQESGIEQFREHEKLNAATPHDPGLLRDFLANVNKIQRIEEERCNTDPLYKRRVHASIVTARNAPAHRRAMATLKSWGVTVNDAFFLGGVDKSLVTSVLKPHIFFDDQTDHLERTALMTPSVHVPFGAMNL
ncbi:5'-nucleotidase [Arthrobacter sp. HS15c]|uniref:5'-nucleotidase n=1 Tax=Arthrobacter sp. HS15c TaxID=3230279 RepID=UPI003466FB57